MRYQVLFMLSLEEIPMSAEEAAKKLDTGKADEVATALDLLVQDGSAFVCSDGEASEELYSLTGSGRIKALLAGMAHTYAEKQQRVAKMKARARR